MGADGEADQAKCCKFELTCGSVNALGVAVPMDDAACGTGFAKDVAAAAIVCDGDTYGDVCIVGIGNVDHGKCCVNDPDVTCATPKADVGPGTCACAIGTLPTSTTTTTLALT